MWSQRLLFLDVFRGLAVLWMIETHVFDVALAPVWRSGWLYQAVYLSNGFVAQAFAFAAGAGFWLATESSPDLRNVRSPAFWRYGRRLAFLFLCGLWLNMDPFSLDHFRNAGPGGQAVTWQFDILHLIAVTAFAALLLHLAVGRLARRHWVYGFLALAVFLTTPLFWKMRPGEGLPLPLSLPLMPIPPSKFPIFPWAGYFLAGVFFMGFLTRARRPERTASLLALLAIAAPFAAFWIKECNFTYPGMSGPWADWYPSPGHSLFRLSGAVLIFALLFLLERRLSARNAAVRFLRLNGQESLWMFLSHVVLVYGSSYTLGVIDLYERRLTPLEVFGMTVFVAAVCFVPAAVWHTFKKEHREHAFAILCFAVVAAAGFFMSY